MERRRFRAITSSAACVLIAFSLAVAGSASADPLSDLTGAVDQTRGISQCSPLQSDPLVVRAAQLANQGTNDYLNHHRADVPFSDPMPALKTIGYTGSKARLLSGYGESQTDAIWGLILSGYAAIPDCTYTQYGLDVVQGEGFVLTSVVLAAP